jgi:hypothetical protein
MTIAQELKVAQTDLCDTRKERDALVQSVELAKSQAVEDVAVATAQIATITAELDGVKVQRDSAVAESAKMAADMAAMRAELDAAKGKLEMAAFKDVAEGQKPVAESVAGEALDVVALVDNAHGAERMQLYKQHKAAYDAAKR